MLQFTIENLGIAMEIWEKVHVKWLDNIVPKDNFSKTFPFLTIIGVAKVLVTVLLYPSFPLSVERVPC